MKLIIPDYMSNENQKDSGKQVKDFNSILVDRFRTNDPD
jgi:hypothetical protein